MKTLDECGEPMKFTGAATGTEYEVVCLRTKHHKGDHEAFMAKAAEADGVHHCCRAPLGGPHALYCPIPATPA